MSGGGDDIVEHAAWVGERARALDIRARDKSGCPGRGGTISPSFGRLSGVRPRAAGDSVAVGLEVRELAAVALHNPASDEMRLNESSRRRRPRRVARPSMSRMRLQERWRLELGQR